MPPKLLEADIRHEYCIEIIGVLSEQLQRVAGLLGLVPRRHGLCRKADALFGAVAFLLVALWRLLPEREQLIDCQA